MWVGITHSKIWYSPSDVLQLSSCFAVLKTVSELINFDAF